MLIASLVACDKATNPTDTAKNSSNTTNNTSVSTGNFTVTTSYDGADTLPTVIVKILQNQTGEGPVNVTIKNTGTTAASVTVTVGIQDYTSSPGATTKSVGAGETVVFSPMVFIDPAKLATLTTLTQSNYQVKATTTIDGVEKVLLNETHLVNMMAKDAMPWYFHGMDLTPYISLFVTPTNPAVQTFLATAKSYTSSNSFIGYQDASIDSGSISDSGSIPASPITKFFGPTTKGHGTISISYLSADPVYLRLLDPTGAKVLETTPVTHLSPTTYSFNAGTWNFVNTNLLFNTTIKYNLNYWYASGSVRDQVKAIFDALKAQGISYSSTTISFPAGSQKVRFPSDALNESAANCIDGTVLMASALEAIDIEPMIVLVPGHAFLGWRENSGSNAMEFVETTMIGSSTFDEALQYASDEFNKYSAAGTAKLVDIKKARALGLLPAARVSR
jgi:hypothetical protein